MTEPPAVWKRHLSSLIRETMARAAAARRDVDAVVSELACACEGVVRGHLAEMIEREIDRSAVGVGVNRHRRSVVLTDVARWLRGEIVLAAVGHVHPDQATIALVAHDPTELAQLSDDTGPVVLVQAWAMNANTAPA